MQSHWPRTESIDSRGREPPAPSLEIVQQRWGDHESRTLSGEGGSCVNHVAFSFCRYSFSDTERGWAVAVGRAETGRPKPPGVGFEVMAACPQRVVTAPQGPGKVGLDTGRARLGQGSEGGQVWGRSSRRDSRVSWG